MEWLLGIAITVALAFGGSVFAFAHHRPGACIKFCDDVQMAFAAGALLAFGALIGAFATAASGTHLENFQNEKCASACVMGASKLGMGWIQVFAAIFAFALVLWLLLRACRHVAALSEAQDAKVDGPKAAAKGESKEY